MAASASSIAEAKGELLGLLSDKSVSQDVLRPEGKPTQGRIDEAIVQLERTNMVSEPVYSELLDGVWLVKYSGSYAPGLLPTPTRELAMLLYGGGFSLGNALTSFAAGWWGQILGFQLGSPVVRIHAGRDVSASVEVEVAGMKRKLAYTAELMPQSGQRMSEEVVSVEFPNPIGNREVPMELRRTILVTYLDDEVMIVRDESGVPDVLVRLTGSDAEGSLETLEEDLGGFDADDMLSSGAA